MTPPGAPLPPLSPKDPGPSGCLFFENKTAKRPKLAVILSCLQVPPPPRLRAPRAPLRTLLLEHSPPGLWLHRRPCQPFLSHRPWGGRPEPSSVGARSRAPGRCTCRRGSERPLALGLRPQPKLEPTAPAGTGPSNQAGRLERDPPTRLPRRPPSPVLVGAPQPLSPGRAEPASPRRLLLLARGPGLPLPLPV